MNFTKAELGLLLLSVSQYAEPVENYLNELGSQETEELAFAAYLTGSLSKAIKTAKLANFVLVKLASVDCPYDRIEDALKDLKYNAEIYDDWEQQIKRWDEVTKDAVKN